MLIRFSIKNWRSFKEKGAFSLIATRELQHKERIPKTKYNLRILPIAAVYGGNASGKTNLFKALGFVKKLVVKGTSLPDSPIPVEPFKLGNAREQEEPVYFECELLIDENIYAFSFSTTQKSIVEEKLVQILSTSEKILYHRKGEEPNFHSSLAKNKFLEFAFKGTRSNQLFLTNSVFQKIDEFKPIYDWFKDTLVLVAPDERFDYFEHFLNEGHPLYIKMNKMLPQLDTGIVDLGGEEIPFENAPLPEGLKIMLQQELPEGLTVKTSIHERCVITRENGKLKLKKLITYHLNADGKPTKFEMSEESDGSQRIIDLLPAFLELSDTSDTRESKVYVIDEIDRSLHTLLIRGLLEAYLATCSADSRSQLLFTTHNVLLMDQDLLRRDEMWITERNLQGASSLLSFSEYKDVRNDKDIKKSYLQGRLGGIPHILLNE